MKTSKKILSLVLAVIMIVCTVPMASARLSGYDKDDTFQFGTYPQTEVKDANLIAKLNSMAPSWGYWVSYDYYDCVQGETRKPGTWMRYTDVVYEGETYRGVRFTKYRPYSTDMIVNEVYQGAMANTYQDDNGYEKKVTYWFKFEPINWRVLDPDTGLALSDIIIDAQAYSNMVYCDKELFSSGNVKYSYFNDASHTNYANDYETSSIRQWLNVAFYNIAFTESEKEEIAVTTLNNDCSLTQMGTTGFEALDSNVTKDKIFMLSYNEADNKDYFEWWEARLAKSSDYAKCQGLGVQNWDADDDNYGCSDWLLRTPDVFSEYSISVSTNVPGALGGSYVTSVTGIRPAMYLKSHSHNYANSSTTAPTCTNKGYTTYFCDCGASYIGNYVNKTSHIDNNGDKKCDYGCGYVFGTSAPDTPDNDCSCNCHKGGLAGLFFKIINFFQKLLGKNKICACGAAH